MDAEFAFELLKLVLIAYGAKAFFTNVIDYHLGITEYYRDTKEYESWARHIFGDSVFTVNHYRKHLTLYSSILPELSLEIVESKVKEFRDKHHPKDDFRMVKVGQFVHVFFGSDIVPYG